MMVHLIYLQSCFAYFTKKELLDLHLVMPNMSEYLQYSVICSPFISANLSLSTF